MNETSAGKPREPIDWDAQTKALEQKLEVAQKHATSALERARVKRNRAAAIRSRLRVLERKARTRKLIQIGGLFVRAAGGELTVPQADLIAQQLTTKQLTDGRTIMAALVAAARKAKPAPPELQENGVFSPSSASGDAQVT